MDRRQWKSDHFNGEVFFNPERETNKGFGAFLKWQFNRGERRPWPKWRHNKATPHIQSQVAPGTIAATFVNHATHLLQYHGVNILTDPLFSERTSPVQWAGPKRVRAPGVKLEDLPPIQIVAISHNHYDHMDSGSIARLARDHDPLFLTPLGNARHLRHFGARNVIELDWWQTHRHPQAAVTLVPALHWSARGMRDRNRALWGGFVFEAHQTKTFFAGDSGYGSHFKAIRQRLGVMDLSLLPIGAYEPRWFMKDHHMNPDDAVRAHLDLESRLTQGIHFGTFRLTDEGIDDPVEALKAARIQYGVTEKAFQIPDNGETILIQVGM